MNCQVNNCNNTQQFIKQTICIYFYEKHNLHCSFMLVPSSWLQKLGRLCFTTFLTGTRGNTSICIKFFIDSNIQKSYFNLTIEYSKKL